MCQQTRVAAVIPYYERFLKRFPDVRSLAEATESDVIELWSGLGYYSRARNLQKAAREIVAAQAFPREYAAIRKLPGVGDYTAAALASNAFGLPHAVVDGNVKRVIARLTGSATADVPAEAAQLLDRRNPAQSNQALMELGALVCIPARPLCRECQVRSCCEAFRQGIQESLPAPRLKMAATRKERVLLIVRRGERILLVPSPRVRGFWDLPEPFEGATLGATLGSFRHSITTSRYHFEVREARARKAPEGGVFLDLESKINLSTVSKKALHAAFVAP
jgi:A/G-specific adenine glycosylase